MCIFYFFLPPENQPIIATFNTSSPVVTVNTTLASSDFYISILEISEVDQSVVCYFYLYLIYLQLGYFQSLYYFRLGFDLCTLII
jgi:hypothetical protein